MVFDTCCTIRQENLRSFSILLVQSAEILHDPEKFQDNCMIDPLLLPDLLSQYFISHEGVVSYAHRQSGTEI